MNTLLIVGILVFIGIIALVAYFMLGKKDNTIQDGKYKGIFVNPEKFDGILYFIISDGGNKLKIEYYKTLGDINPAQVQESNIIKSDMKVTIDGKEYITYMYKHDTGIGIRDFYLVQVPSGKIFIYYKNGNNLVLDSSVELVNINTLN